jgi:hypothetical protein
VRPDLSQTKPSVSFFLCPFPKSNQINSPDCIFLIKCDDTGFDYVSGFRCFLNSFDFTLQVFIVNFPTDLYGILLPLLLTPVTIKTRLSPKGMLISLLIIKSETNICFGLLLFPLSYPLKPSKALIYNADIKVCIGNTNFCVLATHNIEYLKYKLLKGFKIN